MVYICEMIKMTEKTKIEKINKGLVYAIVFAFGMDIGLIIALIKTSVF